jgi:holo-[acyl-carrier protein] synthase
MILGLGTDIVEIRRFEKICTRFGRRFLNKIFTGEELRALAQARMPTLAGRFAAKEAAVKALGTGFAQGISPLHLQIRRDQNGAPQLAFLDKADERARSMGVRRGLLSISHERSLAFAVVVLVGAED